MIRSLAFKPWLAVAAMVFAAANWSNPFGPDQQKGGLAEIAGIPFTVIEVFRQYAANSTAETRGRRLAIEAKVLMLTARNRIPIRCWGSA